MLRYVSKRFVYMIFMLVLVAVVGFILIQLPPGDFLDSYIAQLRQSGSDVTEDTVAALRRQYGLDKSKLEQFVRWFGGMLRGDFGHSFNYNRPVLSLVQDRIWVTILISVFSMLLTYTMAIIPGIISALRQYSLWDYTMSFLAFIAMSVPNFILTILMMYWVYRATGTSIVGLFSPEFLNAPWSLARFWDLVKHMPPAVLLMSTANIASLYRVTRGCMLDEVNKQYVTAARMRGVSEARLLMKYPVRVALNPIISTIGWVLPSIVSGGTIIAIILSLPMVGPLLQTSLKTQDMYLAGFLVVFLSFLTIIGTFISDMLLMLVDPRIKLNS